jgi:hypothetical protein
MKNLHEIQKNYALSQTEVAYIGLQLAIGRDMFTLRVRRNSLGKERLQDLGWEGRWQNIPMWDMENVLLREARMHRVTYSTFLDQMAARADMRFITVMQSKSVR